MSGIAIPMAHLPAFLWAVALVELTPGPNMAYLGIVTARHGRRAGFQTVAGITLGLGVYLVASVIGLAKLIVASPLAFTALRWLGAGYLLWLAIDVLAAPNRQEGSPTGRGLGLRNGLRGFATNILNPKAAIFYLVFLPEFLEPKQGDLAGQALVLGLIHLTASIAVHGSIVYVASLSRPRLMRQLQTTKVRAGFAVALVLTAAWMMWSSRGA